MAGEGAELGVPGDGCPVLWAVENSAPLSLDSYHLLSYGLCIRSIGRTTLPYVVPRRLWRKYVMTIIATDTPTVNGSVIISLSLAASGLTPATGTFNAD